MYFHTNSSRTVNWLAAVLDTAALNDRAVRFDVDGKGNLRVKVGEGTWTAPIGSDPDPYRDDTPPHTYAGFAPDDQTDRIAEHAVMHLNSHGDPVITT